MDKERLVYFLLLLTIALSIAFVSFKEISMQNNTCLKDIAKDFCKNSGGEYNCIEWNLGNPTFYCKFNRRTEKTQEFSFIESEIEQCK